MHACLTKRICLYVCLTGVGLTIAVAEKQGYPFFDGTDEKTAALMDTAEKQIEVVRKGNFALELVDERGQPITATAVVELQSHDFDFGANLFGFEKMPDSDPAKQTSIKAIEDTFNTVIVCDYWRVNR